MATEGIAGITGAVVVEPQDSSTTGTCRDLVNGYYNLSQNVTATSSCFHVLNHSITLDCLGYNVTYAATADGTAVNDTGGFDHLIIRNCNFISAERTHTSAITLLAVTNATIEKNLIISKGSAGHGIILESSFNNTISSNNISTFLVAGGTGTGIVINGTIEPAPNGNFIINNNFTVQAYSISHTGGGTNTLMYNNSFGVINWSNNNLTTTANLSMLDGYIGRNIFLENNIVGIADLNSSLQVAFNLNKSAQIEIKGLTYQQTPDLLKKILSTDQYLRCDNATDPAFRCIISSYDSSTGILTATVPSFSNYTTQENDPPNVTITSPLATRIGPRLQLFNATIADTHSNISTVSFEFSNGSTPFNRTPSNVSSNWNLTINTSSLVEGLQGFRVFANDTYNNINNSEFFNFTIDLTAPRVVFIFPSNGSNFSAETVQFNLSIIDNTTQIIGIQTARLMFNTNSTPFNATLTKIGIESTGNWSATVNFSDFPEGLHSVIAYANDTVGNINQTVNISFIVDLQAPNVSFLAPSNGSNFSAETAGFNVSILYNITEVQTALLMFNTNTTAFNKTLTNNSGNWSATVNFSDFPDGLHSAIAYVNDSAGNINQTVNVSFIVDRTAPTVIFTAPAAGSTLTGTYSFNATILDNVTSVQTVLFQFSNGTTPFNRTALNISGTWNVSVNTTSIEEGALIVTVFANDTVGNMNNTQTLSVTIDNIADGSLPNAGGGGGATTGSSTETVPSESETREPSIPSEPSIPREASPEEILRAFQEDEAQLRVSYTGESAETTYTSVQNYRISITNNLDERMILSGALNEEEDEFVLENEENVKKRLREELLLEGELNEIELEKELRIVKLLEEVGILQVYKTRLSHFLPSFLVDETVTPLIPTGERINANLLRDLLLNAEELQDIEVEPGETIEKEIQIRRGLSFDQDPPQIIFSSGGEEVLVRNLEDQKELVIGTAVDVDPETKELDFYIVFPPQQQEEQGLFTVEMDLNTKNSERTPDLPLKIAPPFFFSGESKTIFSELYGPYDVNFEKGALLAVQYDASALEGDYEVVGKIYSQGNELVAENHFEVKQS